MDDEPALCRTVRRLLRREGYLVDCATNGREAEDLMARRDYDVVVSDIGMPHVGGIELLKRIREHQPDVPVVLVAYDLLEHLGDDGAAKPPNRCE